MRGSGPAIRAPRVRGVASTQGPCRGRVASIAHILALSERYTSARRITTRTLARRATGSSTWLERCAGGRVTIESAIAFVRWLSEHWPPGLEWPRDTERPEPASAAELSSKHASETLARTMRLRPDGQLASVAALCAALEVPRSVYYAVVRRYRDEVGAQRWPRPGSASERMLTALSASGDARFASRRAKDET